MKVVVGWLSVYAMPARDKSIDAIQVCVCARFFLFCGSVESVCEW